MKISEGFNAISLIILQKFQKQYFLKVNLRVKIDKIPEKVFF